MIRQKPSKDSDFSEENMIGKTIVDPEGTIIGKCVGLIEDEKNRQRIQVAITTEIASEFVVEETIPQDTSTGLKCTSHRPGFERN